jgi:response regulator NasT
LFNLNNADENDRETVVNLLMVAQQPGQSDPYIKAACKAGWRISGESSYEKLPTVLTTVKAEVVVLIATQVDDAVLKAVRMLTTRWLLPVVLYTQDSLQHSIHAAVTAGVSVYVVDCHNVDRIGTLLDVAMIRFRESQELKKALDKAKTTLAERNTVEKAKGIIMRQRDINEDTAYQLLRKLAMDRNRRIGEVAGEVIAAAELLI